VIRHLLKLAWHRKRSNALLLVEITASFLVVFAVAVLALYFGSNWRRPLGFDWKDTWSILISDETMEGSQDPENDARLAARLLDELERPRGWTARPTWSGRTRTTSRWTGASSSS
jgi:hypothetical protein